MKSNRSSKLAVIIGLTFFILSSMLMSHNAEVPYNATLNLREEFTTAYTVHDAIWIDGNQEMIDQAAAESWPGNGSASEPFVISGYSFIQDTQPLRIWNTDLHWIFTDNLVDGDGAGVQCGTWIEDAENGVIDNNIFRNRHNGLVLIDVRNVNATNNIIHSNTEFGFDGTSMRNCSVSDNTIYHCVGAGIRVVGGINCTFSHNSVSDCGGSGFSLTISQNSIISSNTINNTSGCGIQASTSSSDMMYNNTISWSDDGINLRDCDLAQVYNNSIKNCNEIGMIVHSGENTTIAWNILQNNLGYAISLESGAEYFEVKFNTLLDNGIDCQICDDGLDTEILCNYYSDWHSPDEDINGFVDVPYSIDGTAENEDIFPLAEIGIVPEFPNTTPSDTPLVLEPLLLGGAATVIIIILFGIVLRKRVS